MSINKQKLIDYLVKNGKDRSWQEIAEIFNFNSPDIPRKTWKKFIEGNKSTLNLLTGEEEGNRFDTDTIEGISSRERYSDTENIKVTALYQSEPSPDQIEKDHNIDTTKWYLHSCYTKSSVKGWTVTAHFRLKSQEQQFSEDFTKMISTYKPIIKDIQKVTPMPFSKEKAFLVIDIQDPHYNKLDITGEINNSDHMDEVAFKIRETVIKSQLLYNLEKIYYIIGSDHFNSEYTNTTTKGTPQQNTLIFTNSFEEICNFEVNIINFLSRQVPEVEVIYCGGNHDQYVSWHMVKYLEAFFRDSNIEFSSDMTYTKYHKRGSTVFCTNHGDVQKPERLAQNFPEEFKEWSDTKYRYILTGDKHTELSRSIGGIEFYQIPSLSPHKSDWDLKMGYTISPIRLTSFLFSEQAGLKNIFKENI